MIIVTTFKKMLPFFRLSASRIGSRARLPAPRMPHTSTPPLSRQLRLPQNTLRQTFHLNPHREFHTTPPHARFGTRYHRTQRLRWGAFIALLRWAARPTFYIEAAGVGALAGGFYVYNLEEVPVSGRRRFNFISVDAERALGEDKYSLIMEQYEGRILPDSDPRTLQVHRVLQRLIPHSGLPDDYEWHATVIDSEEVNAFVIPGGKVFVFTGILPICEDDDGLAVILGHEIGHNLARHVAEQMSRGIFLLAAAWLVELFWGVPGDLGLQLLKIAIDRPKSRAQESEADHLGLLIMAKSCYDPKAAVALWERFEAFQKKMPSPPEILSTHPSHRRRQIEITALLPEAHQASMESDCAVTRQFSEQFKETTESLGFSF